MVIFLSCFSSYVEQREEHPKILKFIENRLQECRQRLSFTVSISPPRYKGRSLSLTLSSNGESIEVDVLPTYDALGRDWDGMGWDGAGRGHGAGRGSRSLCPHRPGDAGWPAGPTGLRGPAGCEQQPWGILHLLH